LIIKIRFNIAEQAAESQYREYAKDNYCN
jgi:hypothetical protein